MESATSTKGGFGYQPALDGVRALAVLAVLGYHFGLDGGAGGYLGVDVFMVLSGFLITSLLATEQSNTGRIDFLRFWGRRIRRLLPALLVLLVLVGLYAWLAAPVVQRSRIRDDGIATLFYVQNWHRIASPAGSTSPLSHTWSLAIEEQWYLIWPPVFLGLTWLCRKRAWLLLSIVAVLAVASASEMAALGEGGRSYFGTDTRAQSLLIGAALALLLRLKPGPVRLGSRFALEVAGLIGIVVFVALTVQPRGWMGQSAYFVVAIAAALFIAASVQRDSPVIRRVLSVAPMRWLGLISYGVYLYHFVILLWLNHTRTGLAPLPLALVRFAVTVVVATLSYRLIEIPVRRGTLVPRRAQIVLAPIAIAVTIAILVLTATGTPVAEAASRNERLWAYSRLTTARETRRVLLVGEGEVFELAWIMHGPFDAPGVRGLGMGSATCSLEDLAPPARQLRASKCRTDLEEAVRGYRPQIIVVMIDPSRVTDQTRAVIDGFHRLRPHISVVLVAPPTTTDRPALDDAALRGPDGRLTMKGARAIWQWLVDGLPARPSG